MKIVSPLPHKKARIEIIPLIDIMFFLLASFMMVSLAMIKMQSIKMDLPTATKASSSKLPDMVNIKVDKNGDFFLKDQPMTRTELYSYLTNKHQADTNILVYITGATNATHGAVVSALDLVRRAGIRKVSFAIAPPPGR